MLLSRSFVMGCCILLAGPTLVLAGADTRKVFTKVDANRDGTASRTELKRAAQKYGFKLSDAELTEILAEADHDKNGSLDYAEFQAMINDEGPSGRSR